MGAIVYEMEHYRPVWRDCVCQCKTCKHEWSGHVHVHVFTREISCPQCGRQNTHVFGASNPERLPKELRRGA